MKRILWNWLKAATPELLRAQLDEFVLRQAYEPTCDERPSPLTKPVVVFSADFELAWAWRYSEGGLPLALRKAEIERAQTPRLLKLLDEHQVPITWATVGLLADRERGQGNGVGPRPTLPAYQSRYWKFPGGDPFTALLEQADLSGPEWYAPDLIEQILSAKAGHEIGSHSFSHHASTEEHCPAEFFEWELRASAAALGRFGVKPTSFVFPGNLPGHHALLEKHGYTCVRHFPDRPDVELAVPRRILPKLWGLNQSVCLEAYGYDVAYVGRKSRELIRKSLPHNRVASLWFHPSLDDADFEQSFRPMIELCADLRDRGQIEILTMNQLARRMDRVP
jgi:peptidoglycan/xylan/chitin deacetylase (PgdA/CDA1 family)